MLIGLLGGGALVQLFTGVATLRQNRRQMNASALGAEVEALEKTIAVLSANLERQNEVHRVEVEAMRREIDDLQRSKTTLETEVRRLRDMIGRQRLRADAWQPTLHGI